MARHTAPAWPVGPAARKFPHEVALAPRKNRKSWRAIGRELGVPASTVRGPLARLRKLLNTLSLVLSGGPAATRGAA